MIIDERERGIERFTLGEITEATSHDFWNQDGAHVRVSQAHTKGIAPIGIGVTNVITWSEWPAPTSTGTTPTREVLLDFQPTLFYIDGPDPENKRAKESFRVVVDQDGNIESMGKSNKRGQWIWWERDKLDGRFYLAPESTNRRSKAQRSPIEVAGIPYLGIPGIDEGHQIQLLSQGIDVAATQAAVEQLFQSRSPQLPTTVFVYKS